MGDRSNIAIVQRNGKTRVYFYAHWAGSRTFRAVEDGLKAGRTDGAYLARNIFQSLLAGDDSILSFGISNEIQDNEHAIIVVKPEAGGLNTPAKVWLEDEDGKRLTPKLSAELFLEVMKTFDADDLHPDDDLLAERMTAAVISSHTAARALTIV